MPECPGRRCGRGWTILALLGLLLGGPAQAHKVGGMGYIAGLFGLLFFVYGRRPMHG